MKEGRTYDNRQRAALAAGTGDRIVDAAEALVASGDLADATLAAIAHRAGVTAQTVLRHHGSRDGCLTAVAERVRARISEQRGHTPPGDVAAALDELLAHYEAEGRLILKLLAQEGAHPLASAAVAEGRAFHRAWVTRAFGVSEGDGPRVDALVGVTDLYLWKLYRLDLGRSPAETRAILSRLVEAVLESS